MFATRSLLAATLFLSTSISAATEPDNNWPRWRGPLDNGSVDFGTYPVNLDSESIVWQSPLPGKGCSTPIIRGEHNLFCLGNEPATAAQDTHQANAQPLVLVSASYQKNLIVLCELDGTEVWKYTGADVHAFTRLKDGNTMMAESGNNRIIVVDQGGRIVSETPLGKDGRGKTRQAEVLENGNYLVCAEGPGVATSCEVLSGRKDMHGVRTRSVCQEFVMLLIL
ncbi:MAG: hypothetical protein O2856_04340 [Planctomycetota bacterium]|nr:hypothetical protein [Planctomycetota bacterium]